MTTIPELWVGKFIKTENPILYESGFQRKATTYSPTMGSTIGADRFNFSVRNGKR